MVMKSLSGIKSGCHIFLLEKELCFLIEGEGFRVSDRISSKQTLRYIGMTCMRQFDMFQERHERNLNRCERYNQSAGDSFP